MHRLRSAGLVTWDDTQRMPQFMEKIMQRRYVGKQKRIQHEGRHGDHRKRLLDDRDVVPPKHVKLPPNEAKLLPPGHGMCVVTLHVGPRGYWK
jgi:hypothetical protein